MWLLQIMIVLADYHTCIDAMSDWFQLHGIFLDENDDKRQLVGLVV